MTLSPRSPRDGSGVRRGPTIDIAQTPQPFQRADSDESAEHHHPIRGTLGARRPAERAAPGCLPRSCAHRRRMRARQTARLAIGSQSRTAVGIDREADPANTTHPRPMRSEHAITNSEPCVTVHCIRQAMSVQQAGQRLAARACRTLASTHPWHNRNEVCSRRRSTAEFSPLLDQHVNGTDAGQAFGGM